MNPLQRPLLSIVLPTRERADTLLQTLDTLSALGDLDHEILVCDNCSNDITPQVVASRNNPHIRHLRTPERLPMPGNFGFGLDHARGHFVMTLGDDDLILPGNLAAALEQALSDRCDLVYWHRAFFYWGSFGRRDLAGYFGIPSGKGHYPLETASLLSLAMRNRISYEYLPNIYNAVIQRGFLERYRRFLGGTWFPSGTVSVDVMSALLFATLRPRTWFQPSPASISGISHHSNGMSFHTDRREVDRFARELGFDDSSQLMPASYRGAVAGLSPRGHSRLSILTDYSVALRHWLCQRHHDLCDCDGLERGWLRRLLHEEDVRLREDSDLAAAVTADAERLPLALEDRDRYFFDFWNIPRPTLYTAKFEGHEATVRHLFDHLQTIGFNA